MSVYMDNFAAAFSILQGHALQPRIHFLDSSSTFYAGLVFMLPIIGNRVYVTQLISSRWWKFGTALHCDLEAQRIQRGNGILGFFTPLYGQTQLLSISPPSLGFATQPWGRDRWW